MSKLNKTIEERTKQLNELLAWFSSDDFTVEAAMDKFKQAEEVADSIKKDLTILKNEINVVKKKFDKDEK